jgi:hypothetical protein
VSGSDRTPAERTPGPAQEARARASPTGATGQRAAVLELQRTAGNRAVRQLLARNGTATATSPQKLFDDAVKDAKWTSAYGVLSSSFTKASELDTALSFVDASQLRYLDDEAKRTGASRTSAVRSAIRRRLRKAYGFDDDHDETGRGFGRISVTYGAYKHGKADPGGHNYEFPMKATFKAEAAAVGADEIAFVQIFKLVDSTTGANLDPRHNFTMRALPNGSTVDRLPDRKWGWYGFDDAGAGGTASGTVNPWKRSAPKQAAWLTDRPQWNIPNSTWAFETAAVCKTPSPDKATKKGDPAGTVYATITWGFTVDNKLKIHPLPIVEFNKPTKDMIAAVKQWNTQAGLTVDADKNSPTQQLLPELR